MTGLGPVIHDFPRHRRRAWPQRRGSPDQVRRWRL